MQIFILFNSFQKESLDVKEQFGHLKDWYQENVSAYRRAFVTIEKYLPVIFTVVQNNNR